MEKGATSKSAVRGIRTTERKILDEVKAKAPALPMH
jgi:hypothetical protein